MTIRFRLNRKEGIVYRDYGDNQLEKIGSHLDGVILWASKKFNDSLFEMPRQDWVQVAILTTQMEFGYFVMNSGTTAALYPWQQYCEFLEQNKRPLNSLITRFYFEWCDSYYDYGFQPFENQEFVAKAQEWLENNPQFSLVDETLPVNTVKRLNLMFRAENPGAVERRVGLIF